MKKGSTIAVTGASGFVGWHLMDSLKASGLPVRAISGLRANTPDLDAFLGEALHGVDTVIHCSYPSSIPEGVHPERFRQDMISVMHSLTEACHAAGVRRIINLSSSEIYGDHGSPDITVSERDPHFAPGTYARCKAETDNIFQSRTEHGIEAITLRLPFIYGPNPKEGFKDLCEMTRHRRLLPFGKVVNRRSVLSITNLVRVIQSLLGKDAWSVSVMNVADPEPSSAVEFLFDLAEAQGNDRLKMVNTPLRFLRLHYRLAGKHRMFQELTSNITMDTTTQKLVCNDVSFMPTDEALRSYYGPA